MSYDVFISYRNTSPDKDIAKQLYTKLRNEGLEVFFSERDLTTTEFMNDIYRALEEASLLILVASSVEHVKSKWVMSEWQNFLGAINTGRKPNGHIMTVLSGINNRNLPIELSNFQYYDARNMDGAVNFAFKTLGKVKRSDAAKRLQQEKENQRIKAENSAVINMQKKMEMELKANKIIKTAVISCLAVVLSAVVIASIISMGDNGCSAGTNACTTTTTTEPKPYPPDDDTTTAPITTEPTTKKTTEKTTTTTKNRSYSDWVTSLPSGVTSSNYEIQTKTQYRYRDKLTTNSNSSSLSGWTQESKELTGYSSWGSWSSWSTTKKTETDLCDVETKEIAATYKTRYKYSGYRGVNSSGDYRFHYCLTCAKEYQPSYTWSSSRITVTLDSKLSSSGSWSCGHSGSGKKYKYNGRYYYYMSEVKEKLTDAYTQYRYRTRSEVYTYYYYKWDSWSAYSDTKYTASSTRQVETRTLYRYRKK